MCQNDTNVPAVNIKEARKCFTFFDLIFGMWVYSDELSIKFEFRSDWMILG
jgi:hypothetical protein